MKHYFDVDIAKEYGVYAAILFENVGFWVEHNRANDTNFHDGKYWTFNSRRAITELFPYIGERSIRTATQVLVDAGLMQTGNYNASAYDRTIWYTLTDDGYELWRHGKCRDFGFVKKTNGAVKKTNGFDEKTNRIGSNDRPIPDINTDIVPDVNTDKLSKPSATATGTESEKVEKPKVIRQKYGEYQNVRLSDEELAKLKQEFPLDWNDRIERLSEYIASKGDKYKSHLATIRSWDKMHKEQPGGKTASGIPEDDPYAGYTYRW